MADEKDLSKSLAAAGGKADPKPEAKKPALTPPKPGGFANVAKSTVAAAGRTAAVKPAEVEDAFADPVAVRLAVVGAGQGGGKIAQAFWDIGYRRVAALNTTETDFTGLADGMAKLSLGTNGAAKDMQLARAAMRGRDEDVRALFARAWGTKADCVLVCAGLGGGSGSGTAVPLVQAARKYLADNSMPVRVGAVVALPSVDNGQKVAANAVTAFRELVAAGASPIIVIDNAKVNALYTPAMSQLFPRSNELVTQLFHLFNQFAAAKSPHMTFDAAEFGQLLDGGICVMGSADVSPEAITSPQDVADAIRDQLTAGVLADVSLETGRKAACVFVASPEVLDGFSADYFNAGFSMLNRILGAAHPAGTEVVVHRGLYPQPDAGLQCYTMVSSLAPPDGTLAALSRVGGLPAAATPAVAKHLRVE